ncbi:MAG: 6-bladed beta-propeller [Thermoanaerobaculia bacterium]
MRASALIAVAGVVGCAASRAAERGPELLVWPPRGVDSPGEILWRGAVSELSAGGLSGVLRAIAGASEGRERRALRRPIAAAFSGNALVVVDGGSGEVVSCKRDGTGARRLPLADGFRAVAVAATTGGEVFVADGATGEVRAFEAGARASRLVVKPGTVSRCGGLSLAANGDLLLTDVGAGEVVRVSPTEGVVARSGRRGPAPGEFNFPTAILEAPDGTVWVLDTLNFRVQHLGASLAPTGSFGQLGDGSGHFALPKGLAMDADGHLYVSDARFDNVQVFDQTGRFLLAVGLRGSRPGEFWSPAGLAFGPDGTLAVADPGNGRVQLLQYRRRSSTRSR